MKVLIVGAGLALCLSLVATADDLSVVRHHSFPGGSCSMDGYEKATPSKKKMNRLKNRFEVPESYFDVSFKEMYDYKPGWHPGEPRPTDVSTMSRQETLDTCARGVSLVGWVGKSYSGGTGESCNCKSGSNEVKDTHIEISEKRGAHESKRIVCEATFRTRILGTGGKLTERNGIGAKWRPSDLNRLIDHKARFSGWLFYDPDHASGGVREDPTDDGVPNQDHNEKNWRQTGWEIHPVTGIEILECKSKQCRKAGRCHFK